MAFFSFQNGPQMIKPGKDQCGNCHAYLGDDAYCRYCGTKAGEGAFEPYMNYEQCVYGPPPIEREHTCQACGFSWRTNMMIDNQQFCPKCGGKVDTTYPGGKPFGIQMP